MPANYSFSGRVILLPEAQPLGGARVDVWNSSKSVQWGRGETAPDGKFACPLAVPANSETLPDQDLITFAVYQGDQLLSPVASSVSWRPSAIMAAAIVLGDAAIEVAVAPQQPIHAEVGLHELTGGISAVIASMQQQLAVYSSDLGTFVVDTLELTLPVHMRVDQLGQVMATVVGGNDSSTATSLHLQIRPVAASSTAPPLTREPLTTLRMLSDVAIAQLQSLRVFSIDDLLRVSQTVAGQSALAGLKLGVDLNALLNAAALLALPLLPRAVLIALPRLNIRSAADFVHADPQRLASGLQEILSAQFQRPVAVDDVKQWQDWVWQAVRIPLPTDDEQS